MARNPAYGGVFACLMPFMLRIELCLIDPPGPQEFPDVSTLRQASAMCEYFSNWFGEHCIGTFTIALSRSSTRAPTSVYVRAGSRAPAPASRRAQSPQGRRL